MTCFPKTRHGAPRKPLRAELAAAALLTAVTACNEGLAGLAGPVHERGNAIGTNYGDGDGDDGHASSDPPSQIPDPSVVPPGPETPQTPWCKVKRLLKERCTECHDGEGSAGTPMGLTSYADLMAEAPGRPGEAVYERVAVRVDPDRAAAEGLAPMPPRQPLSPEEMAILEGWIAAGTPEGDNPSCTSSSAPNTPVDTPEESWPPAECDEVYTILAHGDGGPGTPFTVPAGVEIHPEIVVDAPWGDEPVQAIAFRPVTDNKRVLHHWILYSNDDVRAFLVGWAPGDDDRPPLPPDVGMDMPTGSQSLRFNIHYFNVDGTEPQPDQSGVEVCVVKKANFRPNHAGVTMSLASFGLLRGLAPAGEVDYPSTGICEVSAKEPIHLLTATPHAHTFATHMEFTVKKKDGTEIVMHDQPFAFEEQGSYPLEPEVIVEDGDTIYTTCYYTNTTGRTVRYGESSSDEMCFNLALYYPNGGLECKGGSLLSL